MLDRWFGYKIHSYLQVLGVFILAFGVPMNKVLMSIGTLLLSVNIILKNDWKGYWENWKGNTVFWFIIIIFGLHALGLTYTKNFDYAISDLNSKLPLLAIPLALIAYPIERKYFHAVLYVFLGSLVITSTINFYHLYTNEIGNYRDFSLFGSHIRYALVIVTGILVSIYLWIQQKRLGFLYLILILWFSYYTLISQVLNGYIAFAFLGLGLIIYILKRITKKSIRVALMFLVLGFIALGISVLYLKLKPSNDIHQLENLPIKSKYGEVYFHDTLNFWYENGNHIRSYIAKKELEASWNERSSMDYNTVFDDGYPLRNILIRYMASKGLTKDREGMEQMEDKDIINVEKELSSILKTYSPVKRKMALLKNDIFQYVVDGNPNGNSFLQRVEHWHAAIGIIQQNWVLGVGTGDVQEEFNQQYIRMDTQLHKENWNRAHNQFLTFWITFGIFGFILFTGFWILYLIKNIKLNNLIGIGFTLIAISSFLSEDTIETQQGVTYIALFLGLCSIMNTKFKQVEGRKA